MSNSSSLSSSSMMQLTDDLLLKLLSLLTSNFDSKSFRCTCKAFYRLDSIHRTHLRLLRPEYLSSLLSKSPNIISLDLSACPNIHDAYIPHLLINLESSMSRIKRLVLSRCTGLRSHGLQMLVSKCFNLESVDLSYCIEFGDLEAAAISSCSSTIREICLDKCLNLSDVGLAKLVIGCPNLEKLSVKGCFDITDIGIRLVSTKCDKLKYLDISYLKVTNESLHWIGGMERLEVLLMAGCGSVDDMGLLLYLVNGCPSLQVLDVSRCHKLSSSAVNSVIKGHSNCLLQLHAIYCFSELPMTFADQFKDLKKLKVLRIDGARVTDSTFTSISDNCRSLAEIGLGKCKGVTDTGIMQLVLDLTCCNGLTDLAILAIADSCRDLVSLKLECCNLLGETSFNYIGSRCIVLQEIDLTDCSGLTDKGLKYLSNCSELLSLKLGLCTNISDKGLSYISSNCIKLRELDLYRCVEIGDNGVAALSSGCKRLNKLILSYCDRVTDRGMECLGCLGELCDLELRCLPNITGTGLSKLAAGCCRRSLTTLDLKNCHNIDDSGFWALAYYSRNLQKMNLYGCAISDVGLCMVMGNLTCLQNAKLVNLVNVTVNGFELALRASCVRLKKLKVLASFRRLLSPELIQTLESTGCKIKWD